MHPDDRQCFIARSAVLNKKKMRGEPRRVPCKIDSNPALVFTDGASKDELHTIGGVIIFGGESRNFGCHVPSALTKKWLESSKHIIGMVESCGAVVAKATWDSQWQTANRFSLLTTMLQRKSSSKAHHIILTTARCC